MGPAVSAALAAAFALSVKMFNDDSGLAVARQRDGAAFDMRALGGAIARELVQSDDIQTAMGWNSASHVPTPQPFIVPNFTTPTGTTVKQG